MKSKLFLVGIIMSVFVVFPVKATNIIKLGNTDEVCEAVKSNSRLTVNVYSETKKKSFKMESPTTNCTNTTIFNKNADAIAKGETFVGFGRTTATNKIYVDNVLVKNSGEYGPYSYFFVSNNKRATTVTKLKTLYSRERIYLDLNTKDKSLKSDTHKDLRLTIKVGINSDINIAYYNSIAYYVYTNKKTYGPYSFAEAGYENQYTEVNSSGSSSKIVVYNIVSDNLVKNIPAGETITGIKIVPYENFDIHKGYFRIFSMSLDGYKSYSNGKKYVSVSNAGDTLRHNIVNNMTEEATIKWTVASDSPTLVFYHHYTSSRITFDASAKKTYYGIQYVNNVDTTINAFISQAPKNKSGVYGYKFASKYLSDAKTSCNGANGCVASVKKGNKVANNTLYVYETSDNDSKKARKEDLEKYPFISNSPGYILGLDCSSSTFLANARELPYLSTLANSSNYYNSSQVDILGGMKVSASKVEAYLRKNGKLKDTDSMTIDLMKSNYKSYLHSTYSEQTIYNGYGQLIPGDIVDKMGHVRLEVGYPYVVCNDGTTVGGTAKTKYSANYCKDHNGINGDKSYVIVTEVGSSHNYRGNSYKPVKDKNGNITEYVYNKSGTKYYAVPQSKTGWTVTLNKNLTDLKSVDDTYNKNILSIFNINRKYTFKELNSTGYLPFRYKEMTKATSNKKVELPTAKLVLDKDYSNISQELYNYMADAKKLKGTLITNYVINGIKFDINGTKYYYYPNQTNKISLYDGIKDTKIVNAIKSVNYKNSNKNKCFNRAKY